MVNPGGPSKGCRTCIKRKIGCDQQRPICGQCKKGNRQCSGYRQPGELVFRNVTKSVVQKSVARSLQLPEAVQRHNSAPPVTPLGTLTIREVEDKRRRSMEIMSFVPLAEETGLVDFFANGFTCAETCGIRTNIIWVPSNVEDLLKNDVLKLACQASGAMALARLHRSTYYMVEAQKRYGSALFKLAEAYRRQEDVTSDSILLAVMVLAFFESLASYDNSSHKSWITHLSGISALLERRRKESLMTETAARALLAVRNQVILNGLQLKAPVQNSFAELSQMARQFLPERILPADAIGDLLTELAQLQVRALSGEDSDTTRAALLRLDMQFCDWTTCLPRTWEYSTRPRVSRPEWWWDVRSDVYTSRWYAGVWNNYRMARMTIRDLLDELPARASAEYGPDPIYDPHSIFQTATKQSLIVGICANVPTVYRPTINPDDAEEQRDLPALGTNFFSLGPLATVATTKGAPADLTDWVADCLNNMYQMTGIVKCHILSERLRMRSKVARKRYNEASFDCSEPVPMPLSVPENPRAPLNLVVSGPWSPRADREAAGERKFSYSGYSPPMPSFVGQGVAAGGS